MNESGKGGKTMSGEDIIDSSRKRFDEILHSPDYRRVHADDEQLERLVGLCEIEPGKSYLDIGTGNGYVALALARRFAGASVRGLDIASASIGANGKLASSEGLANVAFDAYDGAVFPYPDGRFAGCVSRYAFHHFPDADASASEIARVTAAGGFFVLSDPVTPPEDDEGFVDRFQSLMPDGHVHFYARREIEPLFNRYGFFVEQEFTSSVRYPREGGPAYERLLSEARPETLDRYAIGREGGRVYITLEVMNILFRKRGDEAGRRETR
ncbi:MAG: methyltransferase domain-containing protein [Spirochaetales bacterium]|nr:methyltransferase domain-containing protein [Spirochaetales bacterium]